MGSGSSSAKPPLKPRLEELFECKGRGRAAALRQGRK